jgi:hypothetical protein
LAPEFWLRHEHIDYEQLVELAEDKLDATDRDLIDLHLKSCPPCQEDVSRFLAFREKIAPELDVSYVPMGEDRTRPELPSVSWWRALTSKPIYAAAVVVIGVAIVIVASLLFKRRAENLRAQQRPVPQVSPTSAPDNVTTMVSPIESPRATPESVVAVVALNDRAGIVSITKEGDISGLDNVSPSLRGEIAKALLSGRVERPHVLQDLGGPDAALRGGYRGQSFRLISPNRTVIESDRPTFKWEKTPGANTYRVYVLDSSSHAVLNSEELPAALTQWTAPSAIKRGNIYSWSVVAIVNGKEIVSPGASASEIKFRILSSSDLRQLDALRRNRSHLSLGIFYAKLGLISKAERELQELVRLNPHSMVAKSLFRSVASFGRSK